MRLAVAALAALALALTGITYVPPSGGPPENLPPSVDAGGPYTVYIDDCTTLAPIVSDPEDDALAFAWGFTAGDGEDEACENATFDPSSTVEAPDLCIPSGAPEGACTLALAVSDGENDPELDTASLTVAEAPEFVLTTEVLASRTSGVAPFAVRFTGHADCDANETSGEWVDQRDCLYFWDFGDPESPDYEYGARAKAGLASPSNQRIGFVSGHVYTEPDTYTATLTTTNLNLDQGQDTQAITVSAWGGTTFCVSSSGTFTDCPGGATQITSSDFDDALAGNSNCNADAAATRCLFRCGETFASSTAVSLAAGPGIIGHFGTCTGSNFPIVTGSGVALNLNDDWRIWGLDFNGQGLNGNGTDNVLLYETTIRNSGGTGGLVAFGAGQDGLYLVRSVIDNTGTSGGAPAGLYAMHSDLVIAGSRVSNSGTTNGHNARIGLNDDNAIIASEFGPSVAGNSLKLVSEGNLCTQQERIYLGDGVLRRSASNEGMPIRGQYCNGSGTDCGDDAAHPIDRLIMEGWLATGPDDETQSAVDGSKIAISLGTIVNAAIRNNVVDLTAGWANGIWFRNYTIGKLPSACGDIDVPVIGSESVFANNTAVYSLGTNPADDETVFNVESIHSAQFFGNVMYTEVSGRWGAPFVCSGTCSPESDNVRVTSNPFVGSHPFVDIDDAMIGSGSALIGQGLDDDAVWFDAFGRARGTTFDAGAFEYVP